jgi:ribosomal protein L14
MIQKNTKILIIDNSGALVAKCIHVCKKSKIKFCVAFPGTVIIITIKRLRKSIPKKLVTKSKVCFALVTGVSSPICRITGTTVKGEFNTAIVLGKYNKKGIQKNKPGDSSLANRFSGSVYHEVKKLGFFKIIALARGVI